MRISDWSSDVCSSDLICITSGIAVKSGDAPENAFRLPEVAGVAVEPRLAEGTKCARSWRVTTDVGSDPDYPDVSRSEEHTSELQSLMRISYAVFCLKKKTKTNNNIHTL